MRTEKELFELMLTRQDLFTDGLCCWVISMWAEEYITVPECGLLLNYLKASEPTKGMYWWKPCKIEPRIEWIKQQIEKL
jgi:hypothetical protein